MVDFSTKATGLEKSGYTGYIQQGVIDKSKAMETESKFALGTQAVEYGLDKAKEYNQYETLKGIAEEIGGVMQEQEDRSYAGQAQLTQEQEALKSEMGLAQEGVGFDGTYPAMLNQELTDTTRGIQNALAEKTDRLTRAREQGAMTEFELETRLSALTREAIARNPALAPEIMRHVSQVSSMNNLTEKVKQDAAILKSQQENQDAYNKSILKMAESDDVNLNLADPKYFDNMTGGYNYEAIRADIQDRQGLVEANTLIKQTVANKESRVKLNGALFIEQGKHVQANRAQMHHLQTSINSILKTNMNKGQKLAAIEDAAVQIQKELEETYQLTGLSPNQNPDIKDSLASLKTQADSLVKRYTENIDNKKELDVTKNVNQLIQEKNKNQILELPGVAANVALYDLFGQNAQLIGLATQGSVLTEASTFLNSTYNTMVDERKANHNAKLFQINPDMNKSTGYAQLEVVRNNALNDSASFDLFENMLNSTIGFIANPAEVNKTGATRDLMKTIYDPRSSVDLVRKLNPEVKGNLETISLSYGRLLSQELENFKQANPDAKFEISDTGEIKFASGTYQNQYSKFSKNTLTSIREAFGSYHKLSGNSSLDKSINTFYNNFSIDGVAEKK